MTNHYSYQPVIYSVDAIIANGQAISSPVDVAGTTLAGIYMPAAFTGTSLTFQASKTIDGTYQTIFRLGADFSVAVAPGKFVALNPSDFAGAQFIKIVSSANEAASRTLSLAVRPV